MSNLRSNLFTLNSITNRKKLIGRDKFITKIKEDYIANLASVLLVGGRRSGKTSLLKCISNDTSNGLKFVYIDIQAVEKDLQGFVINSLNESIGCKLDSISGCLDYFYENVFKANHNKLVIVLDEIDLLMEKNISTRHLFSHLRAALTKYGSEFLVFVLAAPLRLREIEIDAERGSGFLNMFIEEFIPLIETEPKAFYRDYLESCQPESDNSYDDLKLLFSSDNLEKLYTWVGKHPYILQQVGFEIIKEKLDPTNDITKLMSKTHELLRDNVLSYIKKGYLSKDAMALLYLGQFNPSFLTDNSNVLTAWCFTNEKHGLNGEIIKSLLQSIIIHYINEGISSNDSHIFESYRRFYPEIEKLKNKPVDIDVLSVYGFTDYLLAGLVSIDSGGMLKAHEPII